jgi:hypothetical protein
MLANNILTQNFGTKIAKNVILKTGDNVPVGKL